MSRTKKLITPFSRSKAPVQATAKAKPATIQPATLPGSAGTSRFRKAPAAVATAPIERAPGEELHDEHDPDRPVPRARHAGEEIHHALAGAGRVARAGHADPVLQQDAEDDGPQDRRAEDRPGARGEEHLAGADVLPDQMKAGPTTSRMPRPRGGVRTGRSVPRRVLTYDAPDLSRRKGAKGDPEGVAPSVPGRHGRCGRGHVRGPGRRRRRAAGRWPDGGRLRAVGSPYPPMGADQPERAGPRHVRRGALGGLLDARAGAGRHRERRRHRRLLPHPLPWHHRALALGDRDLFGEIVGAARRAGLTVLARMDSTRTYEEVFHAHPDWFARDATGQPFTGGDLYTVCVNGPWVKECMPAILREIGERIPARRLHRQQLERAGADAGLLLRPLPRGLPPGGVGGSCPAAVDWDDPAYRAWIRWSYARRTEIWDAYNRVTHEVGGPDCHWLGMCQGEPSTHVRGLPRPDGHLVAQPDRDARLAGPPDGRRLSDERDGRQDRPRRSRLGQAHPREHGPLPRPDAADVPEGGEARGGGAALGRQWDGRRHPAVVAPPRCEPGGPPPAAHGRAAVAVARRERGLPRRPGTPIATVGVARSETTSTGTAEGSRRPVPWRRSPVWPRRSGSTGPLAGRPRRPRRARRPGAGRARPARTSRRCRTRSARPCAGSSRGRRARGDGRDEPLRRGGPAARRLRAGGSPGAHATGGAPRLFRRPGRVAVGEWEGPQLPADEGRRDPYAGIRGFRGDRHPALRRARRGRAAGAGAQVPLTSCRTRRSRPPRTSGCARRGRRFPASSSTPPPAAAGWPTCPPTSTAASAATAFPTTAA